MVTVYVPPAAGRGGDRTDTSCPATPGTSTADGGRTDGAAAGAATEGVTAGNVSADTSAAGAAVVAWLAGAVSS